MPIKNYTTEVSAKRSIDEIQKMLIDHGASSFILNIGADKEPESLAFTIPTAEGSYPFRLPANVKQVEKILLGMRKRPPEKWDRDYDRAMERIQKQATRVAWRIIKDWIDAQLAIIDTEMVAIEEVFLPYMLMDRGERTLFEKLKEGGFLLTEGRG